LQRLTLDAKYRGGQIGMVGVLHTWTRDLAYHPHVHYLVPGGALSAEGLQWLSPRSAAWLAPVRALSKLFRGKCTAALTTAGLCAPVPPQVWPKDWVTHYKPAGTGTEVLTYFAPYIYRIALTNNRLEKLEDGHVTFRFQKRNGVGWKRLTLPAEAFIHRFLQHVLPKGVPKVRSYGFLSPSQRKVLPQIRTLLATCPPPCPCGREHPPPGTSGDTAPPWRPNTAGNAGGPSSSWGVSRLPKEHRRNDSEVCPDTRTGIQSAMALDTTVSSMSSPPDRTSLVCARPLHRIGPQSPTPTGAFRSARRPRCGHETSGCPATLCVPGPSLSLRSPSAPLKIQSTRLLTTGLFNPALCGGVAPHEFLFVRSGPRSACSPSARHAIIRPFCDAPQTQ
jgi:hypothetical protein